MNKSSRILAFVTCSTVVSNGVSIVVSIVVPIVFAGLLVAGAAGPVLAQDQDDSESPGLEETASIDAPDDEPLETAEGRQGADEETGDGTGAPDEVPVRPLTGPLDILVNPVFPPDQARRVYRPLVDYLQSSTGLELRLVTVRNFHRYWLEARRDSAADLIFEDAHMAAWRMKNFDYEPLVTTSAPDSYSLLTGGAATDVSLSNFVGRRISTLPSPSLGYLVLAEWFDNPLQQPVIESNATSWLDAVEIVFSGEADAAVVPRSIAERYPNLISVETSDEVPGLTLSAGPDVSEEVRRMLVEALTALHEDPDSHAALFELNIDQFVPANRADYEQLDRWLDNVFSL